MSQMKRRSRSVKWEDEEDQPEGPTLGKILEEVQALFNSRSRELDTLIGDPDRAGAGASLLDEPRRAERASRGRGRGERRPEALGSCGVPRGR